MTYSFKLEQGCVETDIPDTDDGGYEEVIAWEDDDFTTSVNDLSKLPEAKDVLYVQTKSVKGLKGSPSEIVIFNDDKTYTRDWNALPDKMNGLTVGIYLLNTPDDDLFGLDYLLSLLKDLENKVCKTLSLSLYMPRDVKWSEFKEKILYVLDHITLPFCEERAEVRIRNERATYFKMKDRDTIDNRIVEYITNGIDCSYSSEHFFRTL